MASQRNRRLIFLLPLGSGGGGGAKGRFSESGCRNLEAVCAAASQNQPLVVSACSLLCRQPPPGRSILSPAFTRLSRSGWSSPQKAPFCSFSQGTEAFIHHWLKKQLFLSLQRLKGRGQEPEPAGSRDRKCCPHVVSMSINISRQI